MKKTIKRLSLTLGLAFSMLFMFTGCKKEEVQKNNNPIPVEEPIVEEEPIPVAHPTNRRFFFKIIKGQTRTNHNTIYHIEYSINGGEFISETKNIGVSEPYCQFIVNVQLGDTVVVKGTVNSTIYSNNEATWHKLYWKATNSLNQVTYPSYGTTLPNGYYSVDQVTLPNGSHNIPYEYTFVIHE